MSEQDPPTLGPDGEPCAACGSPLASDQRYCLACGARRAEARLPFLDILGGGSEELVPLGRPLAGGGALVPAWTPGAAGSPPPPPPEPGLLGTLGRWTPVIGVVGCLLVALLTGVLIGHWSGSGDSDQTAALAAIARQRPQVVVAGGGAPVAAAATTAAPTTTGAASDASSSSSSSSSKDSGASAPTKKTKATNTKVKDISKLSGKQYQKAVDKLGKTIATGGKAPPKDNKPPAAGGSFQDIG